jgi:hypothetical protein
LYTSRSVLLDSACDFAWGYRYMRHLIPHSSPLIWVNLLLSDGDNVDLSICHSLWCCQIKSEHMSHPNFC